MKILLPIHPFIFLLGLAAVPRSIPALEIKASPYFTAGVMYYAFEDGNSQFSSTTHGDIPNPSNVSGEEATFVPGSDTLTLSQEGINYSDWLPFATVGITLLADRFFFDVAGLKAINGDDTSSTIRQFGLFRSSDDETGILSLNGKEFRENKIDFDRWEYTITLGYALSNNASIYVGYRKAKTENNVKLIGSGTYKQLLNGAQTSVEFKYNGKTDLNFTYNGPFLGFSYGWAISSGPLVGRLVTNLSASLLNSKFDEQINSGQFTFNDKTIDSENFSPVFEDALSVKRSVDGDTIGFSAGLGWNGMTRVKNLQYSLGIKAFRYDFDASSSGTDLPGDAKETVVNLLVGLSYDF